MHIFNSMGLYSGINAFSGFYSMLYTVCHSNIYHSLIILNFRMSSIEDYLYFNLKMPFVKT